MFDISDRDLAAVSGGDNSQTGSNSSTSSNSASTDQTNVVALSLNTGNLGGALVTQSNETSQSLQQRLRSQNTRVTLF